MSKRETTTSDTTDDEKSKETINFRNTCTSPVSENTIIKPPRIPYTRNIQHFLLVWLTSNIDEVNNVDFISSITKLRQAANTVEMFTDIDECVDFITDMENEQIFMISSETLDQTMVAIVQDITQVNSVYIFRRQEEYHEQWINECPKVKGVFADITPIYEALKLAMRICDQNAASISFIKKTDGTAKKNLNELDQYFMYTLILKEILLTIDFEQKHINDFLTYCREELFVGNSSELKIVDKIEREYHHQQPIWWYTYNCFLYSMLNRASRTMEVDLIIKMGFFVRALHEHITQLHSEQYSAQNHSNAFIVYRGQGLSKTDFEQLKATQGGLISFNSFLSTSFDRAVSLMFAESNASDPNLIGVLFEISIDPSISSTSFANVREVSAHQTEEEILFSMHSIFRIGQIQQVDESNNRLWQVELTLTSDTDPQLQDLTEHIRQNVFYDRKGLYPLGNLLNQLGLYAKAQQVFHILLDQTTDQREKASIYHALATVKNNQGEHREAITFLERSIEINQKILVPSHSILGGSYCTLGLMYANMREYSKALFYYNKAVVICQTTFPQNHLYFARLYGLNGEMYRQTGDYSKALLYHEKALDIEEKTLPYNHPDSATSYGNIGLVYNRMGEYSKALSYHEKALEIYETTLQPNHPDLATSYGNIGVVYNSMGEYSKALSYQEKALEIREKTLQSNHPDLATSYSIIGRVFYNMGEYSKAHSYLEKGLEIYRKVLPPNHPYLAVCYGLHGLVYASMANYSKALSYHEKALEICQKTFPLDHPNLTSVYNNIGVVYNKIGDYPTALSFHEKAIKIREKSLSPNHPSLAASYNNIGLVYNKMSKYATALCFHEKALEIRIKSLHPNHPDLAQSYNSIGEVYDGMGEYAKALSYYDRALTIREHSLLPNHPDLQDVRKNIEIVRKRL